MKKIVCGFIFLAAFMASSSNAAPVHHVGNVVTGREYVAVLGKSVERDIFIWVDVADNGDPQIVFYVDTALGGARVESLYSQDAVKKLEGMISKAIEWTAVAKKNKAGVEKTIGCFGDDPDGSCAEAGGAYKQNQMQFGFYAGEKGQSPWLTISITDMYDRNKNAYVALEEPEMRKLLANIKKINAAIKEAVAQAKKRELFK